MVAIRNRNNVIRIYLCMVIKYYNKQLTSTCQMEFIELWNNS